MHEEAFAVGSLSVVRRAHRATVTINRPEKLNALTAAFWFDLPETLDRLAEQTDVRAIVLTGRGERAFCAGGDIPGFLSMRGVADIVGYQEAAMNAFRAVENCPIPVIAAVNGLALGGGCELVLACDMAMAAQHASFGLPEARLGLVPGFGALRGPEVIGRAMTRYLIASGDTIDAARALSCGLVQWVVARDHLLTEAEALADRIASCSPAAVSASKRMINATIDDAAIRQSIVDLTMLQQSQDRATGVAAFIARKAPTFTTRHEGIRQVLP